jgi:hypothetical protein
MKLFVYVPYRNYTFGSLIIAANTQEEADAVLKSDYGTYCTPVEFSEVLEGVTAQGQPRIVHNTAGEE